MTGLADAGKAGIAILGAISSISEPGHCLGPGVNSRATDARFDHGIETGLTVRVVTGNTVEAISRRTTSGVIVIEVDVQRPDIDVTIVTKIVAFPDNTVVVGIVRAGIETVLAQATADVCRTLSVTIGTALVRRITGGPSVAPGIVGATSSCRCCYTADFRGGIIAVTGFAGYAGCGGPVILRQVGSSVAAMAEVTAIDSIITRCADLATGNFVWCRRYRNVVKCHGAVHMRCFVSHAAVVGVRQVTSGAVGSQVRTVRAAQMHGMVVTGRCGRMTDTTGTRLCSPPLIGVVRWLTTAAILMTGVGAATAEATASRQAAVVSQGNVTTHIEGTIDMITGWLGFSAPVSRRIMTAGAVDGDAVGC